MDDKLVEEIVINSHILADKYGLRRVANALRGLADSFEKEHEDSFDITKSDFGFDNIFDLRKKLLF